LCQLDVSFRHILFNIECCLLCRLQARHTGIKIVQQIAILLGCAVLPHLKALVDIVKHGLTDENQKVRCLITLMLFCLSASLNL